MSTETDHSPRLRVLVIGGTQFIGRATTSALLAVGYRPHPAQSRTHAEPL